MNKDTRESLIEELTTKSWSPKYGMELAEINEFVDRCIAVGKEDGYNNGWNEAVEVYNP